MGFRKDFLWGGATAAVEDVFWLACFSPDLTSVIHKFCKLESYKHTSNPFLKLLSSMLKKGETTLKLPSMDINEYLNRLLK